MRGVLFIPVALIGLPVIYLLLQAIAKVFFIGSPTNGIHGFFLEWGSVAFAGLGIALVGKGLFKQSARSIALLIAYVWLVALVAYGCYVTWVSLPHLSPRGLYIGTAIGYVAGAVAAAPMFFTDDAVI